MSRILSRGTFAEKLVYKLLRSKGKRPQRNVTSLPGCPDFVFSRQRKIIFVHGCFWHRHYCRRGKSTPSNNKAFWLEKFKKNHNRDIKTAKLLRHRGWEVLIIWECQLKKLPLASRKIDKFLAKPRE